MCLKFNLCHLKFSLLAFFFFFFALYIMIIWLCCHLLDCLAKRSDDRYSLQYTDTARQTPTLCGSCKQHGLADEILFVIGDSFLALTWCCRSTRVRSTAAASAGLKCLRRHPPSPRRPTTVYMTSARGPIYGVEVVRVHTTPRSAALRLQWCSRHHGWKRVSPGPKLWEHTFAWDSPAPTT